MKTKGDLYKKLGVLEDIKFARFGVDAKGMKKLNKDISKIKLEIEQRGLLEDLESGYTDYSKKQEIIKKLKQNDFVMDEYGDMELSIKARNKLMGRNY